MFKVRELELLFTLLSTKKCHRSLVDSNIHFGNIVYCMFRGNLLYF